MKLLRGILTICVFLVFTAGLFAGGMALSKAGDMSVRIVSPQNGQRFEACSDITITNEVTVNSGEINRVYYYYNGRSLKSLRSEPWEHVWEDVKPGIYNLTCKVKDTDGNEYFSPVVQIFVDPIDDGDLIVNGEFACDKGPWVLNLNGGAQATYEIDEEGWLSDHEPMAVIDITQLGTEAWHVMLVEPCPIDSGHSYEISFWAEVPEAKDVGINFQENGGDWALYSAQSVPVDYNNVEYGPILFESLVTDRTADIKFIFGGDSSPIFIDAIKVVDLGWTPNPTDVAESPDGLPAGFALDQNYPNPFNPNTEIRFSIPRANDVKLSIYDVQGRLIKQVLDKRLGMGQYTMQWDATNHRGESVPSGVYFYILETPDYQKTRRMLLLK